MAWLGLIETDSILIKEKHKHLSKMSDRVSKNVEVQALKVWVSEKGVIEVYIDIQSLFVIVYFVMILRQFVHTVFLASNVYFFACTLFSVSVPPETGPMEIREVIHKTSYLAQGILKKEVSLYC